MKLFFSAAAFLASVILVSVDAAPCAAHEANMKTARALLDEVFNGKDSSAVDKYTDGIYLQHNPNVPDGTQSLKDFAAMFTNETKAEFGAIVAEGDLVWVNARYSGLPGTPTSVAMDVFRFNAAGKVAEHWDILQTEVPASETASGRPMFPIPAATKSQSETPTACGDGCDYVGPQLEANKKTAKALLDDLFNKRDISAVDKYTDGIYLQHNPNVPDGPQSLKDFAATFTADTKVEFGAIAAEGDLVWVNARYSGLPGTPTSVAVDVMRFNSAGKIAEHWDILQTEVPVDQTASGRPMFPIQA